jgi:hypothetical protein
MSLILAAAVILGVCPELTQPPPVTISGTATLTTRSQWHQLDLSLKVHKTQLSERGIPHLFTAARGDRGARAWEIKGEDVRPLVHLLHGVQWNAGAQQPAYLRWLGEGPTEQKLTPEGAVAVTRVEVIGFRLLAVSGTLKAKDEGKMGNRFGPNWWRDEWVHEVAGWVSLAPDGAAEFLLLRDKFKVAGLYFNPGGGADTNTREGVFEIVSSPARPLSLAEVARFRTLVARLADDDFDARDKAVDELTDWAGKDERVVYLLRSVERAQTDPETRHRLSVIRKRLSRD